MVREEREVQFALQSGMWRGDWVLMGSAFDFVKNPVNLFCFLKASSISNFFFHKVG